MIKRNVKIAFSAFAAICIAGLAAEVAIRLVFWDADFTPTFFYQRTPTSPVGLQANIAESLYMYGRLIRISIDSDGLRTVPKSPESGAYTLHLVGDSQVFGWGLDDTETIPAVLQQSLGTKIKVINHGVPSYGLSEYCDVVFNIPPSDYVVLLLTEENDFSDALRIDQTLAVRNGLLISKGGFLQNCPSIFLSSYLFRFGMQMVNSAGRPMLPMQYDSANKYCPLAVMGARIDEYMDEMSHHMQAHHLIIGWIPFDGAVVQQRAHYYEPAVDQTYPTQEVVDDLRLRPLFSNNTEPQNLYLPDDPHLSAKGAALVARQIERKVDSIFRK